MMILMRMRGQWTCFCLESTEEENIYLQYDFGLGSDQTYEQNVSFCLFELMMT